jgi:quinol monooxygenase YgiN
MPAFNVVRFRVKPGQEQKFIDAHKNASLGADGFKRASLVKTGDRTFCIIGEWDSMASLANARPQMIGILDKFRDTLEDLGGGLGVTDPVSGETVLEMKP